MPYAAPARASEDGAGAKGEPRSTLGAKKVQRFRSELLALHGLQAAAVISGQMLLEQLPEADMQQVGHASE